MGLFIAATGLAPPARAADVPAPVVVRQEAVGFELTPVAFSSGKSVTGPHLGVGGLVRVGRHRWRSWYWTPLQAGIYLAGSDFTGVVQLTAQTEGGAILRTGWGTWEMGLAAGAGSLGLQNGSVDCDGSCVVGGAGPFASPVLRYLFRETARIPIGVVLRAQIPLAESRSDQVNGYLVGWGTIVLAGLDVAYGW